jgi:hypothetical protein
MTLQEVIRPIECFWDSAIWNRSFASKFEDIQDDHLRRQCAEQIIEQWLRIDLLHPTTAPRPRVERERDL